ncbi:hypothetical protein Tco_0849525 [Tanacetum coccineum]
MRDIASAFYHSLHPSETPPLLPIPAPSTSRRADITEADTPPRKRLLLTTPRPGYGGVDKLSEEYRIMESRFRPILKEFESSRDSEILLEKSSCCEGQLPGRFNSRESSEFYTRHHDARRDRSLGLGSGLKLLQGIRVILLFVYHAYQALEARARFLHMLDDTGSSSSTSDMIVIYYAVSSALTWCNSHVMTVTHDVAYSMTWVDLRKKMTDKYCLRNEMKKLEAEL